MDHNDQRQVTANAGRLIAVSTHECVGALFQEMEANAHLIAAAPEMLEALEYLMEEVCKRGGDPFDGATDTASAAIARAKGG